MKKLNYVILILMLSICTGVSAIEIRDTSGYDINYDDEGMIKTEDDAELLLYSAREYAQHRHSYLKAAKKDALNNIQYQNKFNSLKNVKGFLKLVTDNYKFIGKKLSNYKKSSKDTQYLRLYTIYIMIDYLKLQQYKMQVWKSVIAKRNKNVLKTNKENKKCPWYLGFYGIWCATF